MKHIKNITLVLVDCRSYSQALISLKKSLQQIAPARTIFFTDIDFDPADNRIEVIKIDKISSLRDYSHFIIMKLYQYIETSHVLITQWDSWVLNGHLWKEEFLKYDLIGSKWNYKDGRNVGNLGFGLLSKRLLSFVATDSFIRVTFPDDEVLGRLYREYLELSCGFEYAPEEVADEFAFELHEPVNHTVGFHGFHHKPFKDCVIISRLGALGDLIMCEPIIQYYHDQGYQVVLDTQPQFMSLFFQHPFKIKHISEMNPKIKPIKEIDLNMAYELKPKIPVLKAYCEKAGIEIPLRNSRLNINITPEAYLFDNYVLIHNDNTGIAHRNVNDLDWSVIVKYLQLQGYQVFQIGKRTEKKIAPHLHTENIEMLMYIIKGAKMVIGIDSGICQIAVALNVPIIILASSVNLKLRYTNFENIIPIQGKCSSKDHEFCYHATVGSTTGTECVFSRNLPPCTFFDKDIIIDAIKKIQNVL